MTRLTMPSAMPADRAEVLSDVETVLSANDLAWIEMHADLKLKDRLYNDAAHFADLLSGMDFTVYADELQRALRELDAACGVDLTALNAITTALSQIQRTFKAEAKRVWGDELAEEAETELFGVGDGQAD